MRFPKQFLNWLLGLGCAWALTWLLLGGQMIPILFSGKPHPFLDGAGWNSVLAYAIAEWLIKTLSTYLVMGLITGLVLRVGYQLVLPRKTQIIENFRSGFWIGLGTALWVHGNLYASVPTALSNLPLLRQLPMIVLLLAMLVGGLWILIAKANQSGKRGILGMGLGVTCLTLLLTLPHDVFRAMAPDTEPLSPTEPRLVLLGLDAVRRDVFETANPEWAAPSDLQTVTPIPSTRLLWNHLLGADPEIMKNALVVPNMREFINADHLTLVSRAENKKIKSAFLINDSTTLAFGLQSTWFTTVLEPQGGWKYWFTLGFGTTWPVFSWVENFISNIETSNAWSDPNAYIRDTKRAIKGHNWVNSHYCALHAPFHLTAEELHGWRGWRWLWEAPVCYRTFPGINEAESPLSHQFGWRADAKIHYGIRVKSIINKMKPFISQIKSQYPNLSGVIFSDHGEKHPLVMQSESKRMIHLDGIHGFRADGESLLIAFHPFGKARTEFHPNDVFSLTDLRDSINAWLKNTNQPLLLKAQADGWLFEFISVHAMHLDNENPDEDLGIKPRDLVQMVSLSKSGRWFIETDGPMPDSIRKSTVIARGRELITFDPAPKGNWDRSVWIGFQRINKARVTPASREKEIAAFEGKRLQALN